MKRHSNQIGKRKVTANMCNKIPHLVVGDAICHSCRIRISKMPDIFPVEGAPQSDVGTSTSEEECQNTEAGKSTSGEEYVPENMEEATVSNLNVVLTPLGESPISRPKLLRVKSYAERKASAVAQTIKKNIFNVSPEINDGQEIINQFKEKFASVKTANEKYMILTCLPKSWSEHKIISEFGVSPYVAHIAKQTQTNKGIMSVPDRKYQHNIPDSVVKLVTDFYIEDDISRLMPGMKDTKSVREGGKRVKKQKRLLLANLKELYKEFKVRHPVCKIGFSRFASLRPKYCILAGAPGTHNVCVCTICENAKLMLKSIQDLKYKSDDEMENLNYFVKKMVCNDPSPNCYLNKCKACPGDTAVLETLNKWLERNLIEEMMYKKWTTTDRAQMSLVKTSSENFIHNFVICLKKFKIHNFIAKAQSSYLKQLKSEIKPSEFIVIGDYSENYSFIIQDAIQGCHWSNSQATIHPFVVYYRNTDQGDLEHISFCIISEYLVHDTASVHLFQKHLISYLKEKHSGMRKIYYFSDGAAGQYKNRKNFANLVHHDHDFQVSAEWNFFATSHGKSSCDGVGGTVKRLAAHASLQGTLITTPKELYEWAKCNIHGIRFSFTSIEEHENEAHELNSRFFSLKTVPGTRNIHCVVPMDRKIVIKTYSNSEVLKEVVIRQ